MSLDRKQEAELFDYLCRNRKLQEWLEGQLAKQVEILLVNPNHEAILKAQGAASFIKTFQDGLQAAINQAKK